MFKLDLIIRIKSPTVITFDSDLLNDLTNLQLSLSRRPLSPYQGRDIDRVSIQRDANNGSGGGSFTAHEELVRPVYNTVMFTSYVY